MPKRKTLTIFWLNKLHFQLLTQWANPQILESHSFYGPVLPLVLPSWISSVLILMGLSMSTLWVFDYSSLGYCFECGSFSTNGFGFSLVNYGPWKSRNYGSIISRGIWLWLRVWQLLKIEESAEFEPALYTKPHMGFWGLPTYADLCYCFMFFKLQ